MEGFYCEKLMATMQVETCAQRHVSQRFHACAKCCLGALNASIPVVADTGLTHTCSRCRQQSIRLVESRLCKSCYNRQLEVFKGRNRRGGVPKLKIQIQCGLPVANKTEIAIDVIRRLIIRPVNAFSLIHYRQYDLFA